MYSIQYFISTFKNIMNLNPSTSALERRYCKFYCTVCAVRYYTYKLSCGQPPPAFVLCAVSFVQKQYLCCKQLALECGQPPSAFVLCGQPCSKQYAVNSWSCVRFAYVQYAYKYLNSVDRCKKASFLWKL